MKSFIRAAVAAALIALPALVAPLAATAHTVGFEFEDYVHAWPAGAPPHDPDIPYPTSPNTSPSILIRYDDRLGYKDLEVHVGPLDFASLPSTPFANYNAFYGSLASAASSATETTLASWYKYKPVGTFGTSNYQLGYVTQFLKSGIPNKLLPTPAPPASDVGPQATFSLGTREVYAFFKDRAFPFFRTTTTSRINTYNSVDAKFGTIDDCLSKRVKPTVYGCSLRARGFVYFLAEYLNNTVDKLNALNGNPGEVKKESYPLLLRNIAGDTNAVKEYFDTIVASDELIRTNKSAFILEMQGILPQMVGALNDSRMTKANFIDAYLDFLAGSNKTGFVFGPKGSFGEPVYTFQILSDSADAVIKRPLSDTIYMECRSMRSVITARHGITDNNTYAVPYTEAVAAAEELLEYLRRFHLATGM